MKQKMKVREMKVNLLATDKILNSTRGRHLTSIFSINIIYE
jgi:hypothetical protein